MDDRWIDALATVDQWHWLYRERADRIARRHDGAAEATS